MGKHVCVDCARDVMATQGCCDALVSACWVRRVRDIWDANVPARRGHDWQVFGNGDL